MQNLFLAIIILGFTFIIGFAIIYISIRFWGYYCGSIKYYAERSYYKKRKIFGNPEDYF